MKYGANERRGLVAAGVVAVGGTAAGAVRVIGFLVDGQRKSVVHNVRRANTGFRGTASAAPRIPPTSSGGGRP